MVPGLEVYQEDKEILHQSRIGDSQKFPFQGVTKLYFYPNMYFLVLHLNKLFSLWPLLQCPFH